MPCTRSTPCNLASAISVATAAVTPPILRILPGIYAVEGVDVQAKTSFPLRVVATDATITTSPSIRVTGGANVEVRNITLAQGVLCGIQNTQTSRLAIADSTLLNASSIRTNSCTLDLQRTEFAGGQGISLESKTTFTGDRLHFKPVDFTTIGAFGTNNSLMVTNSLLENTIIEFLTDDLGEPGSTFSFAFNTWVQRGRPIVCRDFNAHAHILFEDNILVDIAPAAFPFVIDATACEVRNNILQPQPNAPPTNIVGDPQFVDPATKNFHLKTTSPAIDKAMPSASLGTDHDFDGTARPQGTGPDIGAFELPP